MPSGPPTSEPATVRWALRSVRVRLLALALLPMVAVLPIVLGCALFWWLAEYYAAVVTLAAIVLWLR